MIVQITLPHVRQMIYFKRTPSGLRTATAICAPASSPRISARCSCVRGAYAPPSRSAEGLGDFSDLLAEADPAGAAGAACSALGRLGAGRLRARVPVPVRVQAAALRKASGHGVLKPVSSSGLFILALCWLSSVIGVVSFFTAATGACMMLLLLHGSSAGACRSQ